VILAKLIKMLQNSSNSKKKNKMLLRQLISIVSASILSQFFSATLTTPTVQALPSNTITKFETDITRSHDLTGVGCYRLRPKDLPYDEYLYMELAIALTQLNSRIEQEPNNFHLYNTRALIKRDRLQDFAGALADWNRAIQIDANSFTAYRHRAILKQNKFQDFVGALADFDRAIQINPQTHDVRNLRAILKATQLKDPQGALADFNALLNLPPNYDWVNLDTGTVYSKWTDIKTDRFPGAFKYGVCWNSQDYAKIYRNRGLLKQTQLNDAAGALADYQQAQKIAQ
jgi:tetratricopeptide (TPR) repeat protein